MTNIIALLFFLFALYYSIKKDVYTYLIGISLFLNIGGYFNNAVLGFPGYFTFKDISLSLVFITFFIKHKIIYNKDFKELLSIIVLFIIYQIFISIYFKLETFSIINFIRTLAGHKWRLLGIFICIPTYYYIQRYSKQMYFFMLFTSSIILIFYFITLTTPFRLIATDEISRDFISADRVWFKNPGYIYIFPILLAIIISLKKKVHFRNVLLFAGVGSLLSLLLTLTRGTILFIFGNIFIIFYLVHRVYNIKVPKLLTRGIIISSLLLMFIGIISPGIINNLTETTKLSVLELTGKIDKGTTQSRSEFEIPTFINLIVTNPIFGTGMLEQYFSHYHESTELGVADVPILGHIAMYGILGFLIFLLRYFKIHSYINHRIPLIIKGINRLNIYEVLFLFWGIASFYANILFRLFNFSSEIYNPDSYLIFGISVGIIYGVLNKLFIIYNHKA